MDLSKYKSRAKCNICGKVRYTNKLEKFDGHSYCKVTNNISSIKNEEQIFFYDRFGKKKYISITKCQKQLISILKNRASKAIDLHNVLIDSLFWIHSDSTNLKLTLK